MVRRWFGLLCVAGLLFGVTGCASQQVDLVGEWVYENPSGDGAARISIQRDGTFEITGWPSNLKITKEDVGEAVDEEDLNWDEPLSFEGKLNNSDATLYRGVYFHPEEGEAWFSFFGVPSPTCSYVLLLCNTVGEEIRFFLVGLRDDHNYVAFVREGT